MSEELIIYGGFTSYRIRLVSISCDPNYLFSIDGHDMNIIEVDGVNSQPHTVNQIQIYAAQRYSFVVCVFTLRRSATIDRFRVYSSLLISLLEIIGSERYQTAVAQPSMAVLTRPSCATIPLRSQILLPPHQPTSICLLRLISTLSITSVWYVQVHVYFPTVSTGTDTLPWIARTASPRRG